MNFNTKGFHFKYFLKKRWLKIFYHNTTGGQQFFFQSDDEVLWSHTPQKYSILGLISDKFKINEYYEFLLEYSEIEGFNNRKQKIFPRDVLESMKQESGYTCDPSEGCSCSWIGKYWKGLSRSFTSSSYYLDGSFDNDNWWYAIGAKTGSFNHLGFPGPVYEGYMDGIFVHEATLWLRCSDMIYHSFFCINISPNIKFIFRTCFFTYILFLP